MISREIYTDLPRYLYNDISCVDLQTALSNDVFNSAHSLLITLYDRDCRRSFTPDNHWLIKYVTSVNHVCCAIFEQLCNDVCLVVSELLTV